MALLTCDQPLFFFPRKKEGGKRDEPGAAPKVFEPFWSEIVRVISRTIEILTILIWSQKEQGLCPLLERNYFLLFFISEKCGLINLGNFKPFSNVYADEGTRIWPEIHLWHRILGKVPGTCYTMQIFASLRGGGGGGHSLSASPFPLVSIFPSKTRFAVKKKRSKVGLIRGAPLRAPTQGVVLKKD